MAMKQFNTEVFAECEYELECDKTSQELGLYRYFKVKQNRGEEVGLWTFISFCMYKYVYVLLCNVNYISYGKSL